MHIDIFSAVIFNIISSFFMGASLLFVAKGYLGEIKGVKHWAVGLLFQSLGWFLHMVTKILPEFTFIAPIATSILITGAAFYFHALVEFKEVNISTKPLYQVIFGCFLSLIYFGFIDDNISVRIVIGAFSGYLIGISISYLLFSKRFRKENSLSKSHFVTGCVFVFCTIILGFRAFYFSLFPADSIFVSSYLQDLTYVFFHLVISLTSFSFLLMCSEKYAVMRTQTENVQHQTVQALRESEHRFRTMLDISPVPLGIHDEKQNVIFLNHVFIETFGYNSTDISTFANWWEKAYPDANYRARIIRKWMEMLQTTQENNSAYSSPIEMIVFCKNGTQKTVLASVSTFSKSPEKLYLFVFQDITQRKQNEIALLESEFRWKFALEGSGDGLWDWNIATNKVYFTKRWKEMLGFENHEIGEDLSEWESRIHPDDKDYTMATVQAYFDLKIPVYVCEHRVGCKDGSYKWILDRGIVVQRDAKGNPLRMIGTHTDISAQKQTEEKLQQLVTQERESRLEQSQFMAMLGHELKTPLSVISMILGMSDLGEETRTHCNRAIGDINNVVERCLLSEKIADKQLGVSFSNCNLMFLLEFLKNKTHNSNRLTIKLEADFVLQSDSQLLQTILLNLIDNAFKYSLKNSQIEILAKAQNAGLLITVKNAVGSAGFPEVEKVFEKYYRSKSARSQTGSGLGLYLVKSIANLIGGEVVYRHNETHVMFDVWLPFQPT